MPFFQTDNLRVDDPRDGLGALWLNVAGQQFNVLSRQVLADLEAVLDQIAASPAFRVLVINSDKPTGFLAGADIHEFTTIPSPEKAAEASGNGQRVFGKLENLPVPSVAVIQGPCLGGGLELALACDYRLVVDHPKTQLGFPEIELGIIPGWGGTQRLPRVVGLERALPLILSARRKTAREARELGLADAVAKADAIADELQRLVDRARTKGKRKKTGLPLRTWKQRLVESTGLGRGLIYRGAERVLRERVPDDMPAPHEALKAVQHGLTHGLEAGLGYEREANARLMATPACRNLVGLFLRREEARKVPAEVSGESAPAIRRVGVVGAGMMGAGIAQLATIRGCEVVIQEVSEAALQAGVGRVQGLFQKAVERGVLSADEARAKAGAIRATVAWEGFADVDLVVEAVIEEPATKQAVFRELAKRTRPTAILATNTSSLRVGPLADDVENPERLAGLHFFNPVHKMHLVEVVHTPRTAPAVVEALRQWAVALGKTPVVVKDSPGFVVNRVLMPYLNEAVLLVAEGMPIERIDQTMRRFGMPMGPLELLDQVGLDVAAHVARTMQPEAGDRFTPNPAFERMAAKGWLGQKSGWGFYRYDGKKKTTHFEVPVLLQAESARDPSQSLSALAPSVQAWEARERLVLLTVNEAAACLGEGLTADAETIDLAMVLGTGWAPHRGGPLRYAQDRGPGDVVTALEQLVQRRGPRFEPHPELRRRSQTKEPFYRPFTPASPHS